MIRRSPRRKLAGIVVLIGTLVAGLVIQLSSGIIHLSARETYRGPVTTTPISQSQVVEYDVDASVNWSAALPLVGLFVIGLVLAVLPSRGAAARRAAT